LTSRFDPSGSDRQVRISDTWRISGSEGPVVLKQPLDFASERIIAAARLAQERSALGALGDRRGRFGELAGGS